MVDTVLFPLLPLFLRPRPLSLLLSLLGKHSLYPVFSTYDGLDERWTFGADFADLVRNLIALKLDRLIAVGFDELSQLLRPGRGGCVEPGKNSRGGREDDRLTVVEPGKVGVGSGCDNGECPECMVLRFE